MPQFVAITAPGCMEALSEELVELGYEHQKVNASSIEFRSNWKGCYEVNLRSRIASRILLPVLDFPAYNEEELYNNIRKHDFTKYIGAHQTLRVESKVDKCAIRNQQMVSLKVKDAIVDQFYEAEDARPNVDRFADLVIYVRAFKNNFVVSVDTSFPTLHKRGYRMEVTEAPLKENVAAALVDYTGWDCETPLIDPMCGSGTLLIEAALKMTRRAAGSYRKSFAFQKFKNFDKAAWEEVSEKALGLEKDLDEGDEPAPIKLFGYDKDRKAIRAARKNAEAAEVDHLIEFKGADAVELEAPEEKGMLISNLPYGIRSGDEFFLEETYKDFAYRLKGEFKGWQAWFLSGNPEMTRHLRMKAERKIPINNGGLDCRFLHYKIKG